MSGTGKNRGRNAEIDMRTCRLYNGCFVSAVMSLILSHNRLTCCSLQSVSDLTQATIRIVSSGKLKLLLCFLCYLYWLLLLHNSAYSLRTTSCKIMKESVLDLNQQFWVEYNIHTFLSRVYLVIDSSGKNIYKH